MKKIDVTRSITMLANIGVLGGLLFLGYETRQNTIQLRAQASSSITEGLSRLNTAIHSNAVLADIVVRGEQELSSLNPTELAQFGAYEFDRTNLAEQVLNLEREGITDVQFPYVDFLVQEFHRKPGLRQFLASVEDTWVGVAELHEMLRTDQK